MESAIAYIVLYYCGYAAGYKAATECCKKHHEKALAKYKHATRNQIKVYREAINNFCREHQYGVRGWKEQPEIKALFDLSDVKGEDL